MLYLYVKGYPYTDGMLDLYDYTMGRWLCILSPVDILYHS